MLNMLWRQHNSYLGTVAVQKKNTPRHEIKIVQNCHQTLWNWNWGHLIKLVEDWFTQQATNFQNKLPDEVMEADVSMFKKNMDEFMDNKSITTSQRGQMCVTLKFPAKQLWIRGISEQKWSYSQLFPNDISSATVSRGKKKVLNYLTQ